jgi:hypothetical protein
VGEPIAEVGYLAGLCGFLDPNWTKALIDADGHLQIDVVSSGGSDLQDVVDQLEILAAAIVYRSTTPVIYNKTMTSANTEYSQALPSQTKKFTIKCRGEYDIKLAFTAEASGTTYITIPSGQCYWDDNIRDASCTLYFQCATAAQVVEIVAWN